MLTFISSNELYDTYNAYIRNTDSFCLQTSFVTLDEAIKITNRRVNAIEHGSVALNIYLQPILRRISDKVFL